MTTFSPQVMNLAMFRQLRLPRQPGQPPRKLYDGKLCGICLYPVIKYGHTKSREQRYKCCFCETVSASFETKDSVAEKKQTFPFMFTIGESLTGNPIEDEKTIREYLERR